MFIQLCLQLPSSYSIARLTGNACKMQVFFRDFDETDGRQKILSITFIEIVIGVDKPSPALYRMDS